MSLMSESGNDFTGDAQGWEPPPLPPKPTYEDVCDICGQKFKGLHGVSMHKVRVHSDANWSGRPKDPKEAKRIKDRRYYANRRAREREEKKEEKKSDLVLRQVFELDGRILLVNENDGSWWVAQRWEM